MKLPSSRVYGGFLALVRFLTGGIWLIHGVPKFLHSAQFMPPAGVFATYLQAGIVKTTGPYHGFLVNAVAPNATVFAELVRFGEVCVGISLLLGLFTRIGGFVGVLLPLNYLAARGALGTLSGWSSIDGCLMLLSALSFALPTGRVAGLDALMSRPSVHRSTVVAELVPERPLDGPTAPQ
ncbi:MAG TPA: TQO small subunit DoxD [Candidatus Cybelea sp.]|nr:TQO small subunit DoxD [Candidatus Cybelea sp.]